MGQQISRNRINRGGVSLREDNNTLVVAGHRGIISRSRHCMNLSRWFTVRTNTRSMAKLAAGLAPNIGHAMFGRQRRNQERSPRPVVLMFLGPRSVRCTLSKNKSLLFLFDGSGFGFLVARGPSRGVRALIEKRKALVRGFRIQVFPVPVLVMEVSLESSV